MDPIGELASRAELELVRAFPDTAVEAMIGKSLFALNEGLGAVRHRVVSVID